MTGVRDRMQPLDAVRAMNRRQAAKLRSARDRYEQMEAERARDVQARLRAAFYERQAA